MILQGGIRGYRQFNFGVGELEMNPVVGLDVAKGGSQVRAFLDKKKPYKNSFKVIHALEGLIAKKKGLISSN